MSLDLDNVGQYLPTYLSAEDRSVLLRELKAVSSAASGNFFLDRTKDEFSDIMLQGDGWTGLTLALLESNKQLMVRGMVLSNSCDVDPQNPRDIPARVVFAPLVKLSTYRSLLSKAAIEKEKIDEKLNSIRSQKTTNMFFLPAGGPLEEEHVVRLDDIHSLPISMFQKNIEREKLFTLSNLGFYLLAFKLSIHFCRLQEKVNRNAFA